MKLSPAQQRVMLWLSQGWGARVSHGSAVEINGNRVCNVDTYVGPGPDEARRARNARSLLDGHGRGAEAES